jgi:hypothetical protein
LCCSETEAKKHIKVHYKTKKSKNLQNVNVASHQQKRKSYQFRPWIQVKLKFYLQRYNKYNKRKNRKCCFLNGLIFATLFLFSVFNRLENIHYFSTQN